MKILMAGAESVPFASSGGLGDVMGSLPVAVKKIMTEDDDIRVVLPLYEITKEKFGKKLTFVKKINVKLAWRNQYCGIFQYIHNNVIYYFIDNEYYFRRKELYGCFDDGERFAFFSKAILEIMKALDYYPDILHANDWHTALSVVYLKCIYSYQKEYKNIKALYTIHNIDYQGIFDFSLYEDIFDLECCDRSIFDFDGNINLTKAAIVCADMVSTVSENYAKEIKYEYFSGRLNYILNMYSSKICGILNGIDTDYYNPSKDKTIAKKFDFKHLKNKAICKQDLQRICGLKEDPDVPIIAVVSRLASHKGFDLIKRVFDDIVYEKVQFVLLGTGEEDYENFFRYQKSRNLENVSINLAFDKDFAKKIYAGADIFLMPSKSEPCGLSQMIASVYGTVPVVHEVGGLYDSIKPYNEYTGEGNGFTFKNYNAHEMLNLIRYVLSIYADQEKWRKLIKNVMNVDFSWTKSAEKYMDLYEKIKNM